MRCPKCQYISFDSADRCKHCGYEFLLSEDAPPQVDVQIRRDEPGSGRSPRGIDALDAPLEGRDPSDEDREPPGSAAPRKVLTDLPLFIERIADDQAPLVSPPAAPRAPLSVRRTNPTARGRHRPVSDELPLDAGSGRERPSPSAAPGAAGDSTLDIPGASTVRRFGAGLIDLTVLGAIWAAVVYLTLRLCGLGPQGWTLLPLVPLVAFLLLLSGGYFVLFTAAGGQTIGKMVAGIRVVSTPPAHPQGQRVPFTSAMLRTAACLGSVVVLGAGFLPVLFRRDGRAFHDRVADTRVVPS